MSTIDQNGVLAFLVQVYPSAMRAREIAEHLQVDTPGIVPHLTALADTRGNDGVDREYLEDEEVYLYRARRGRDGT